MRQRHWILLFFVSSSLFAQKVIENGLTPKGKAKTLVFSEDITFGGGDESDMMLWVDSRTKIVPDTKGFMYITDPKENRVLEFNPEGEFVRVMAKAGQGPGEHQGIKSFTILENNYGVMLDGPSISIPKIKIFNPERKLETEFFIREFGIPAVLWVPPNGKLSASIFTRTISDKEIGMYTGIVNQQNKLVKTIHESKHSRLDLTKAGETSYWSGFLAETLKNLYEGFGLISFTRDNHVLTAVSNTYEIVKWNPDLSKQLMVVKREYKPIRNSDEHIQAIVDVMVEGFTGVPLLQEMLTRPVLKRAVTLSEPPPNKNPVFGIIPMEKDGFLVVHDIDLSTGYNLADIYSNEGEFLGQVSIDGFGFMSVDSGFFLPRMIFRNGFAYTILSDEYGENRAVRYTYKLVDKES